MSLTTETEELLKEKATLKNIFQSMEKEEEYLRRRFRILDEKLAIQELKEKIKAKRAVVEQLKSKVSDLERRLQERQEKLETSSPTKDPKPGVVQKVGEPKDEESIEVIVEPALAVAQQSKKPEEQLEGQQKEKRLFPALLEKLK